MAQENLKQFIDALDRLVKAAKADGGKSYDDLAERIRQNAADGMIEEALGYVPEELEPIPEGDPFKPLNHYGPEGKQTSKEQKLPTLMVEKNFACQNID